VSPTSRRPVVALLTASGVSLIGSRLSMIALPLFVLLTTGSATRTGLVAMAEMAPYVVLQALAGPITDRVGARRMSVVSDLSSVVVVGAIPVLHSLGALHFATLLVLVAVAGAVRGPGDGAKYLLVPPVAAAAGQPIERVLGLEDGVSRFASVVGPLGAAAFVGLLGPATALAIDAVSFGVAGLIVLVGVPRTTAPAPEGEPDDGPDDSGYLTRLRGGAAFLRRDGLLRSIIGMVAVTNLLDAAMSGVLIAVWARSQGGGAGLMGVVAAAMSAGAVIGAVTAAAVGHRLPRRLAFTVGFLAIGLPRFAVLGLGAPLWAVCAVVFVGGLGAGVINPILGAVELERVPTAMRARVMSLMNSAAWALIPFGGLVGGLLSDHVGISTALLTCGVVYAAATLLPALRPEWRDLDRAPTPSAPATAPVPVPVPSRPADGEEAGARAGQPAHTDA
jgi:MFS family permease